MTSTDAARLAELAAETAILADVETPAAAVAVILGAARRAGMDPRITAGLCAALAALGTRPYDIYRAGRGSGPRYDRDHELRGDAGDAAASFRDTTARLTAITAETELAQARAEQYQAAAAAAVRAGREHGTREHVEAARKAQWDAACRLAAAAEILTLARGAVIALTFAAGKLEELPDVLGEVLEPLYEIKARPGGVLPGPDFITGEDPMIGWEPPSTVSLR
jgi:hypothetical protein